MPSANFFIYNKRVSTRFDAVKPLFIRELQFYLKPSS